MNKPILFNTEMVQAILEGRKTVTRRIVNKRYENTDIELLRDIGTLIERQNDTPAPEKFTDEDGVAWYKHTVAVCSECNPPYQTGDVMWVRETWKILDMMENASMRFEYLAGGKVSDAISISANRIEKILKFLNKKGWLPSLFMPREAARIFLRVTDVRAERLQEITTDEIVKEGAYNDSDYRYYGSERNQLAHELWESLWNSTIKPADLDRYGWDANPWVWVIEFERAEKPEDFA